MKRFGRRMIRESNDVKIRIVSDPHETYESGRVMPASELIADFAEVSVLPEDEEEFRNLDVEEALQFIHYYWGIRYEIVENVEESRRRPGRMLREWYQASEEEVERRKKTLVGKLLKNIYIDGEDGYRSEGICTSVDDSGQIHGTWGVAIQPGTDSFSVGSDEDLANYNRKKAEQQENTRKYFDDVKVTITPRKKGYGLAAKVDCVYHGQEVKNIKVYEGVKGPFVGYPTWDVIAVDPSQKTIRDIWGGCWREFEKEVMKEYNKAVEEKNESCSLRGRMLREGLRANADARANKEKEVMERAKKVAKVLNDLKEDGYKFLGVGNVEEFADSLIHKDYGSTLVSNGCDFAADISDKETLAAVRELRKNKFIWVVDELHSEKRNEAYIRFEKSCFTDEKTFKELMDFLS